MARGREFSFLELPEADLIVDAIYRGGDAPNAGSDPIAQLLPVGNSGGFRTSGGRRLPGCRLAVLFSNLTEPNWPDELDAETGRFTYYGDNRHPRRQLHETPRGGNNLLRDCFDILHGSSPRRETIPPFLVFTGTGQGRDVRFRGLAVPGFPGLSATGDLVADWKTSGSQRFQNYRATFTVLDISIVTRSWITDVLAGQALSNQAPPPYMDWVRGGEAATRQAWVGRHRTHQDYTRRNNSSVDNFDLTPDPKVLVALTHTPLQPLDALCELIDNSIDSFRTAQLQGTPVLHPLVIIELPGRTEVERGEGAVRIRDNGQGLTREQAEKALRAGYSGNNPFDNLGLFGMGFNISTGKIGRTTRFMTARRGDTACLETVVDLVAMQDAKSYRVPVRSVPKPHQFEHGTVVEIRGWWPEGNANAGFIRKLAGYTRQAIRREIGRRYATILRKGEIRILVNNEPCEPHEHCVWAASRFVERKGRGQIPAVYNLDQVLGVQTRCIACWANVDASEGTCPACGSSSFRTIEERVRGWAGIQRFDDQTEFGIDLIRNGRAIRISEKAAFFEFTDEFKKTTKDYPIDSPFGRIVGEINLDHVPVDFLKQDFQRSSQEWQKAIEFLRGNSSLQPAQPGADQNDSVIFKLFQGYRRVRKPGKTDLYMGFWDPESGGPKRISRDTEKEYYEKFRNKDPGYYDDTEWWKLVEQADQPPLAALSECPVCHAQNLKEHEVCSACGAVINGKTCVNHECQKTIALSAVSCAICGASQVPEIKAPWRCDVCRTANSADRETCTQCSKPRGTPDPLSREYLLSNADKDDDLSLRGFSVELPDGSYSQPVDIDVFVTKAAMNGWDSPALPVLVFKGECIEIFVDKSHNVYKFLGVRPEVLIAAEFAQYLYDFNRRLLSTQYQTSTSVSNLTWGILNAAWSPRLQQTAERIRAETAALFDSIRRRLAASMGEAARDVFDELTDTQKSKMVSKLLARGDDLSRLAAVRDTGEFVTLLDSETVVAIFKRHPGKFFDGAVWRAAYLNIPDLPESVTSAAQEQIRTRHLNCLEDLLGFEKIPGNDLLTLTRARASLDLLSRMD